MDTIIMNSKNTDPHRLTLNLRDKKNSKRSFKYVVPSNLSIYMEKYQKVIQKQI